MLEGTDSRRPKRSTREGGGEPEEGPRLQKQSGGRVTGRRPGRGMRSGGRAGGQERGYR